MVSQKDIYAANIFFKSALPLVKVICESVPKIGAKFENKSFVFQVSAVCEEAEGGLMATHFVVDNGVWSVVAGKVYPSPDIEFKFSNLKKFITFFSGKGMPLPKIKGLLNIGTLAGILSALLKMAGLLQAKEKPQKKEDKALLVKLFFYLLPNGISQLNKLGYEPIKNWTISSPDRAYAFMVEGEPELQSWIRIKAGNSKSGRGEYKRCSPFLTMKFDNIDHALDILMQKGDMMDYIKSGKLTIMGAPEFGAILGGFMMDINYYAKALYMDEK